MKEKEKKLHPPKKIGQSGGASWWRVCYQRGLPRLVIGMKPSVILDYLETCIGNHLNILGALLSFILYAFLEAFNVRGLFFRCFFQQRE